jgi:hypothetical protein
MQRLGSVKGFFGRPPKREQLVEKIQPAVMEPGKAGACSRLCYPVPALRINADKRKSLQIERTQKSRSPEMLWAIFILVLLVTLGAMFFARPKANAQGPLQIKVQIRNPVQFLTPELSAKVEFLK